ncbi:MAG TPA: hypothetical protein VKA80_14075 [Beijerinckiaceae bacterium]|nr:hypothetical protein [Beijerinckiaceae bacterium]
MGGGQVGSGEESFREVCVSTRPFDERVERGARKGDRFVPREREVGSRVLARHKLRDL